MKVVLLLLLLPSQEEDLLRQEILRISAKTALTEKERSAYKAPPCLPAISPVKIHSLAILPVVFEGKGEIGESPLFEKDVRDYFTKESGGLFHLLVKRYETAKKKQSRDEFGRMPIRSGKETLFFKGILQDWIKKEGKGVLALHDSVAFLVEGRIGARGSALWPHQGSLSFGRMKMNYIVMPAKAGKHAGGIAAHEFGHLLGLKDRYGIKHHCLMGTGYEQDTPASLCCFCQIQLGWMSVTDTSIKNGGRKVLVERQVLRVAINPGATEKMILAVREGKLVIWREQGVKNREYIGPFPTKSRDRCTPLSQPGFIGSSVGAREVWLTDIRSDNDSLWFHLAEKGVPTPLEKQRQKSIGRRLGP